MSGLGRVKRFRSLGGEQNKNDSDFDEGGGAKRFRSLGWLVVKAIPIVQRGVRGRQSDSDRWVGELLGAAVAMSIAGKWRALA